jgi:peptidoglycan/LPS O-acetylase OafA/YrhL
VMIALAPVYRSYAYERFPFDIGAMDFKAGTFTLASFDSLAMGSLLALLWREMRRDTLQKYLTLLVLPAGLVLYVSALALYHYRIRPSVFFTIGDFAASLIFMWLVSSAATGFTGSARAVLELRPLVYLGKITYGIYVYHYLVPLPLLALFSWFGIPYRVPSLTNFVLSTLLTVAVASLSWHLFELPINNLKRRFEYSPVAGGMQRGE